jgi:hypothetical protein
MNVPADQKVIQQRDHASRYRQNQAFHQQLPHQPPPARTQRHANGKLAPPRHRPHQHQIGNVGARQQQHQARDRHQHRQQQREKLIRAKRAAPQRRHRYAVVPSMFLPIILHLPLQQRRHFLLRPLRLQSGFNRPSTIN